MPNKGKKKTSIAEVNEPPRRKTYADEKDPSLKPDFIYGGPFIQVKDTPQFLDTITPLNVPLQGTFKQSFAYFSLKERLPIILTKVIDQLSKQNDKTEVIQYIAKLKSDLIRNKKYDLFTLETPQTRRWNEWILQQEHPYYFTNTWVFSECYVYARLWEGFQLNGVKDYDPFQEQKQESFALALEPMCVVATKMMEMLPESGDPDKFKMDFITLLKLSLWSNRCDLSLTAGEQVTLKFNEAGDASTKNKAAPNTEIKTEPVKPPEVKPESVSKPDKKGKNGESLPVENPEPVKPAVVYDGPIIDPFKMIVDFKDRILVDDSNKIAKQIENKSLKMAKKIEEPIPFLIPHRKTPEEELENPEEDHTNMLRNAVLASSDDPNTPFTAPSTPSTAPSSAPTSASASTAGTPSTPGTPSIPGTPTNGPTTPIPEGEEEKPNYPCFAKMTKPREIIFDIVCDNSGYELFTDLCLGHYLVSQKLVQKVRFHVKKIPWFVSDVTEKDFQYVIKSCRTAEYKRELPPEEKKEEPTTEGPPPEAVAEQQPAEPEPPPAPRWLTAEPLQQLGNTWQQFLENGTFILMADDFWVSPHVYSDMKKYAYNVYRRFQFSLAILFKGDLNYRKLMGEINWAPQTKFPAALRTFKPAPVIALRTVKAEMICGLRKKTLKKVAQIAKAKPKWKETGEYGLIQFCGKAERLKVSEQPCPGFIDYKRREPEPPPEPEPPLPEPPSSSIGKSKSKTSKVAFKPDSKEGSPKGGSPTSAAARTPNSGSTAPSSPTSGSPTPSAIKTDAPKEQNPK